MYSWTVSSGRASGVSDDQGEARAALEAALTETETDSYGVVQEVSLPTATVSGQYDYGRILGRATLAPDGAVLWEPGDL